MNLKILWMYHDLMDLYGDKGNAEVLRRRAEKEILKYSWIHVRLVKKRI